MFKFLSDDTFYPLLILCEIWKNCSIRIFNELNKEFLCVFLKMPFLFSILLHPFYIFLLMFSSLSLSVLAWVNSARTLHESEN